MEISPILSPIPRITIKYCKTHSERLEALMVVNEIIADPREISKQLMDNYYHGKITRDGNIIVRKI